MSFEQAVGQLNSDYFFREFTFSSTTFKPNPNAELELADNVVWLDDLLILFQVKERNAPEKSTAKKERTWFEDEVLKKATRQVRGTLSYLKQFPTIEVRNNRGHVFNIATAQTSRPHKVVVYNPHVLLPEDCALRKYHVSGTAGVIHIIHSAGYFGILQTLVTPVEVAEYLNYRENLVQRWGKVLSDVSEEALVGHYLRNLPEEKPIPDFVRYVRKLEEQDKNWDISRIIHLFQERLITPGTSREAIYIVVQELAKLYRTEMAEFKKRFDFSMKKALADEPCQPHRFSTPNRCGFVFIPLLRKDLPHRDALLANFTRLNKYDQKLDRCVGLTVIAEGSNTWCDVHWCRLEFPWKENHKLQAALAAHYPFRPVKERITERYGLFDLSK